MGVRVCDWIHLAWGRVQCELNNKPWRYSHGAGERQIFFRRYAINVYGGTVEV
jgi:hypothetical protein